MRLGTTFLFILSMITMASVVNSQFGYGYRNWFSGASFLDTTCLPDESPCLRMTDCCSTSCHDISTGAVCKPSPCGCPQPPWTNLPIKDNCRPYNKICYNHDDCCSLYCGPPYARACRMPLCFDCA